MNSVSVIGNKKKFDRDLEVAWKEGQRKLITHTVDDEDEYLVYEETEAAYHFIISEVTRFLKKIGNSVNKLRFEKVENASNGDRLALRFYISTDIKISQFVADISYKAMKDREFTEFLKKYDPALIFKEFGGIYVDFYDSFFKNGFTKNGKTFLSSNFAFSFIASVDLEELGELDTRSYFKFKVN